MVKNRAIFNFGLLDEYKRRMGGIIQLCAFVGEVRVILMTNLHDY